MRLEHPIFRGPLQAEIRLDKEPEWNTDFDDRGTWLVQTGEPGKEVDFGVVSDGHGFEDSPDCERISGGINSKGPHAVAIGRQANMLQWGFYAAPDRMTESAKKVFLNAIVYMKRFDGHRPLVERSARARDWMMQHIETVRAKDKMDPKFREANEKYLKQQFPKEVIGKYGLDADALEKWRKENVEYFRPVRGRGLGVDRDLKSLGLSNRKPEFLDWLVKELEADAGNETALRLAARYLGKEAGKDAATAVAFIRKNREKMFFSDTGGYRWYVDPR